MTGNHQTTLYICQAYIGDYIHPQELKVRLIEAVDEIEARLKWVAYWDGIYPKIVDGTNGWYDEGWECNEVIR